MIMIVGWGSEANTNIKAIRVVHAHLFMGLVNVPFKGLFRVCGLSLFPFSETYPSDLGRSYHSIFPVCE